MSDTPTRTPGVFLSHANARTNEYGRNLAVERYLAGHKVRDIAGQLGISRTTVYKWIARYALEGPAGLADRCLIEKCARSARAGCCTSCRWAPIMGPRWANGRQ